MPLIFNNPDWKRTAERQVGGHEYANLKLDSALNTTTTPIYAGMVGVTVNGVVKLADPTLDGGAFTGIFLCEVSPNIDELNAKDLSPTLVVGPAKMWISDDALDSGATFALSSTTVVELVAGTNGRLTPRAANTGPTVAHLEDVVSDGIIINLLAPSSEATASTH